MRRPIHPTVNCAWWTWASTTSASASCRGPTNEKPGDPVPVLWHDYTPEIYYITSGSGVLTTGGVILQQRVGQGVPNTMNGPSGSGIAGPAHTAAA